MNVIYPVICHYEDSGYWCEFPDLDGCFSQGDTEIEIIENAKEALEGYVISILEKGETLPVASSISDLVLNKDDFSSYISADISTSSKFVRKNVTLPEWLALKAKKASINFSQLLQDALIQKLAL